MTSIQCIQHVIEFILSLPVGTTSFELRTLLSNDTCILIFEDEPLSYKLLIGLTNWAIWLPRFNPSLFYWTTGLTWLNVLLLCLTYSTLWVFPVIGGSVVHYKKGKFTVKKTIITFSSAKNQTRTETLLNLNLWVYLINICKFCSIIRATDWTFQNIKYIYILYISSNNWKKILWKKNVIGNVMQQI